MSTYAIGDIQGCFDELQELLAKISFDQNKDKLWLTGDLVNRGPKSTEVLRFAKNLGDSCITVLGNHDIHLIGLFAKKREHAANDVLKEILHADDCVELINWLRAQKILHYDPKLNFAISHAGIYPLWNIEKAVELAHELEAALRAENYTETLGHIFGNTADNTWHENLSGTERLKFIANAFTRMRFCENNTCRLDFKHKSADHIEDLTPWYQYPTRQTKNINIAFGHWASLLGNTDNTPNVFAIDTGCCWGHSLTALRLEDQKLFSITCQG